MESEDHRHFPRSPRTPTSVDDCTYTAQGFPGISLPPTYHPISAPAINLSPESLQWTSLSLLLSSCL
ncbi:hypothetical protein CDL15_Pgr028638 [Punica granatum]|uniref:Uncharacterized protein n=1 Tax=Punica granatum TaxID=22663 RepID=A0A218VY36_PUNGR|nr:hypothetical protein CDL15_Pgr028638 [Punica granatum]